MTRSYFYIALLLLLASSCQTRDKVERTVRQNADTCYYRLMEAEVDLIGEYLRKQDFNDGLKFECRDQTKAPYPSLFAALDSMRFLHDRVLDNRGNFYTAQDSRLKRIGSYKKADVVLLGKDLDAECSKAKKNLAALEKRFWVQCNAYDSLCLAHVIYRVTHGEYADSLLNRLMLWEDSLEEQGRMIGKARSVLKASGLETLSDEYQRVYTPVSHMEKLHKDFQAKILTIENQHGRYDGARPDEWFYRGPYLVARHDVDKSEQGLTELATMMVKFRALHQDYAIRKEALGMR